MTIESGRFEKQDVCTECGGALCCGRTPCLYAPSDFGDTPEAVLTGVAEAVRDGYASIRRAKGDTNHILVSAPGWHDRDVDFEDGIISDLYLKEYRGMHNNPCTLWRSNGCAFTLEQRPLGGATHACNTLRAALGDEYDQLGVERARAQLSWNEYQTELRALAVKLVQERQA